MRHFVATAIVLLFAIGAPSVRADLNEGREAFLRGDYAMALRAWRPLAEQGVAEAQSNLGEMYKLGLGVARDYAEAVWWYRRASMQGHVKAYNNVGGAFYTGKGVPRDYAEAARWFRKASERGDTMAQFNLGLMYARGEGVARDDVQAYKWFYLAAARAVSGKMRYRMSRSLNFLAGRMTPAQLAEARRLVREWMAKFQEARNKWPPLGPGAKGRQLRRSSVSLQDEVCRDRGQDYPQPRFLRADEQAANGHAKMVAPPKHGFFHSGFVHEKA